MPIKKNPKTVREFSSGGVVARLRDGEWWMIAIEPSTRQAAENKPVKVKKKTVWALPKGIVDPGETPEATAIREVREETGVKAELLQKLGDVKYVYQRSWGDGARVFKVVSFYLLRYQGGRIGDLPEETKFEIAQVKWIPLSDAPKLLTYKGDREMARAALRLLNNEAQPAAR